MKVSTRGRYGLRAMLELAEHFGGSPVMMNTLAERQRLSRKYLHTLLTSLKAAGLVRSIRGPGGGFVLARLPGRITLSEILLAVEGPLSLVDCVAAREACDRAGRCTARRVWRDLSGVIESALDKVSLESLLGPRPKACSRTRSKSPAGTSRRGSRKSSASDTARRDRRTPVGKRA